MTGRFKQTERSQNKIDFCFVFSTVLNMKTSVPGLYRGVQVWRCLSETDEASLDQLAGQTGYPKASVLRMLRTLCDLHLVERGNPSGLYRSSARIVFSEGSGPDFERCTEKILERLSAQLDVTAEWFEPPEKGLLLARRISPPDTEIRVRARTGFLREWGDELDSVGAMGYAFYSNAPSPGKKLWMYDSKGDRGELSAADARAFITTAFNDGVLADTCYNSNGVKRIAASVVRNGELAGVASLACAFTPSLDIKLPGNATALRLGADELQRF